MEKKYNILIVEDDSLIANNTRILLKRLYPKLDINIADSSSEAKELINKSSIDLVLLDINLGDTDSGIDFSLFLTDLEIPFIFITAYSDKATIINAIKSSPLGYMIKPVSERDLYVNMELALAKIGNHSYYIFKDGKANIKLNEETIYYFKAEGNYTEIYTDNKRYVIRKSLRNVKEELQNKFIQTHRSFCVNPKYISEVSNCIQLINNQTVPLSRSYKKEVMKNFLRT